MKKKLVIWLKMYDLQIKSGVKNMFDMTIKEIKGIFNKKILQNNKLKNIKYGLTRIYFHSWIYNLALKIIINCTVPTAVDFRTKLRFKQFDIMINKESSELIK